MAPGRHFKGDPSFAFQETVLQYDAELNEFIALMIKNNVRSYLEIGSKFGGSLWRIGSALPLGSLIVSIDLPNGTGEWEFSQASLSNCVMYLNEKGQSAKAIFGDSTDHNVIRSAMKLAPFDMVYIDGDHRLDGLKKDWENYGPLGKMVAFHDIAWKNEPKDRGYVMDVPPFWNKLKRQHKHVEIKLDPTKRDNGIGVLWKTSPLS